MEVLEQIISLPLGCTWLQAKKYCQDKGAQLAEFPNMETFHAAKVLAVSAYNTDSWWVGANDRREEGKWQWEHLNTNPTKVSAMWQKGEPNNVGGNQNCAWMYKKFSYKLDDGGCNEKYHIGRGFSFPLCQRKKSGGEWIRTSYGTFLFGHNACKGGETNFVILYMYLKLFRQIEMSGSVKSNWANSVFSMV